MAIKYVWSGASGSNDGSSWANAWTSLASATGVSAGDFVYVHKTHSEDPGNTTVSYSFSNGTIANPVRIVCVDKDNSDALATGATIANTASGSIISMSGSIYVYGVTLGAGWQVNLNTTGSSSFCRQVYESCTFKRTFNQGTGATPCLQIGNAAGYYPSVVWLINCTHDQSALTSNNWVPIRITGGKHRIVNLTIVGANTNTNALIQSSTSGNDQRNGQVEVYTSDLSSHATLVDLSTNIELVVRQCKLHASFSTTGTPTKNSFCRVENSDDGTITVPSLGLNLHSDSRGTVSSSLSVYRTGGADDGEQANAYSWQMATNANALEIYNALESPPLTRWTDPDASISSATAKGIFTSTRCAPLATPTALTTDSTSTWNGSGVGTKQKIAHTLTNGQTLTVYVASGGTLYDDDFWIEVSEPDQVGGPVVVRCFLAKPSTTVYVDPQLEIV